MMTAMARLHLVILQIIRTSYASRQSTSRITSEFFRRDAFRVWKIFKTSMLTRMTFAEKLATLTEGRNKQDLSERAGLPQTAISDYIAKGNTPRADKALAIARVLNVTLDWLVDDAAAMPPVSTPRLSAAALTDGELMEEVATRRRHTLKDLAGEIGHFGKVNWGDIRMRLNEARPKPSDPLSPDILADVRRAALIPALLVRAEQFDVSRMDPDETARVLDRLLAAASNLDFPAVVQRLEGRADVRLSLITATWPWFDLAMAQPLVQPRQIMPKKPPKRP
jgi:transcriptional regulator with XRE-family HTH domain